MYVCQCRGVTDRQINGAVAEGCTTLRSVAAATGAGTACGGCISTIKDLVCGACPSRVVALECDDAVGAPAVAAPAMTTARGVPLSPRRRSGVAQPA